MSQLKRAEDAFDSALTRLATYLAQFGPKGLDAEEMSYVRELLEDLDLRDVLSEEILARFERKVA